MNSQISNALPRPGADQRQSGLGHAEAPAERPHESHFSAADTLRVAAEPRPDGCTLKVCVEVWEQVRREVAAAGSAAPRLLNIGVK